MSESYESNTDNLAAFLVSHLEAQHKNVTTFRTVRKATRYRASTVVTRRDNSIMHARRPLGSSWEMDMMSSRSDAGLCGDHATRSVVAGGQVRLSDLHK